MPRCSFAEHVLIVAGHGLLLSHLPRPLHLGGLCPDGVCPLRHHLVICGVAHSLDACLDLVFQLGALSIKLVGFFDDILLGRGDSLVLCQELCLNVLPVAICPGVLLCEVFYGAA